MITVQQQELVSNEIRKLTPVLGKANAVRISKAYLLGDEKTRLRIIEMIDAVKAATFAEHGMKDVLLLEPPSPDAEPDANAGEIEGEIELGHATYGGRLMHALRLGKEKLLMHMGVFGSSGYGKTNLSQNIIIELAKSNVPVIVFDFSKMNYRDLLATDLKDRIDVYTIGKDTAPFEFNPLLPPDGISRSQWAKEFASVFDHAYWLLGGGRHIVLKALNALYEENKRPTLQELRNFMIDYSKAVTSREKNWISTAERPMESLCMKELDMLNCRDGRKPSEFFRPGRITIIELDALSENDKAFFIEIILQWIRDWLLVSGSKEKLAGVAILEEAHHVLNREKTKKMGSETVMDLVFREVRELGLGIVYLDQHPSMVSYPALGNTSTHIYMSLGLDTKYSSDVQDAASMLGLAEEDSGHLRRLSIGEGCVLMRNSRFPYPFTAKFRGPQVQKGSVGDEEVAKHMKARLPSLAEEICIVRKIGLPEIHENGARILRAVGMGKGVFASQLYRALRMSGSTFRESMKALVAQGVVGMKPVKLKRTTAHYYFLTDLGEEMFRQKFGAAAKEQKMEVAALKDGFERAGYEAEVRDEVMIIRKGGEAEEILLVSSPDRNNIYKVIGDYSHYICATDELACIVVQEAARYAKNNGRKKAIHVATQDMRHGFEKLEL